MLSTLPVETLLEIIQHLPISTITSLSALSKSWAAFMAANEQSIYFRVSKRYGYTSEGDANPNAPPGGWKAWRECSSRFTVRGTTTILQSFADSRLNSGGLGSFPEIATRSGHQKTRTAFMESGSTREPNT